MSRRVGSGGRRLGRSGGSGSAGSRARLATLGAGRVTLSLDNTVVSNVAVHVLGTGRQSVGRGCCKSADKHCQRRDGNEIKNLVKSHCFVRAQQVCFEKVGFFFQGVR